MTESNSLTGQTIGRYQILEHLGQGGMAEVYKAYQPSLDRYVAIKVMHAFLAREEGFLARFQREAKNVAALQHPNIIQVFDFDVHNGMPYMVMEFIEGMTLKTHLENLDRQRQPLSVQEALVCVREVGRALAYAHQRGMIHRDVKPANVLLGQNGRVILTDFGIAKILTGPSFTATGATVGTPAYMSPEQSLGRPGDHRSDLYALGVMLYQLCTHQLPYDADTPLAVMLKHVNEPLPLPRSVRADLPENLERVILKSMAKSPDDRFQSADEMLAALEQIAGATPTQARPAVRAAELPTEWVEPPPAASPVTSAPPPAPTIAVPAAPPARQGTAARPRLLWVAGLAIGLILCVVIGIGAVAASGRLAALFQPATATAAATTTSAVVDTPAATSPPTQAPNTPVPATSEPDTPALATDVPTAAASGAEHKICGVSSAGGFADRSFNQRAYDGLLTVEGKLGWDLATLESKAVEDYFPHLAAMVDSDCDLIVAVGFLLADVTLGVAEAHPDERFQLLDYVGDGRELNNVWLATYAVNEAAFLAGYTAASVSQTGVVATFGGLDLPPVLDYMDGFALGVASYNQRHDSKVQVLGWNPTDRENGTFIGNFDSTLDGYTAAATQIEQGADVIFPVAGEASFGAAQAAQEHPGVYVIGVDTDWVVTTPEYSAVILTSVIKLLDSSVFEAAEAVQTGTFQGGLHIGNLANGGVGLAPFYDNQSLIPLAVQEELPALQADISAGHLPTKP